MEVLIGNKKDCIDEILEEIDNLSLRGKQTLLLDYGFYHDILNKLETDLSTITIFMLDNTKLDEDFVLKNKVGKVFYPCCEDYKTELLFHKIDLGIIGIELDGSIGHNHPGSSFDEMFNDSYLGIKGIMNAKTILFYLEGEKNQDLVKRIIESEETIDFPASVLMNHEDITAIIDKKASMKLD